MNGQLTIKQKVSPQARELIKTYAATKTPRGAARTADVIRDRARAVVSYFEFTGESPITATVQGVGAWLDALLAMGRAENTIYRRWSFLNSFFKWVKTIPDYGDILNPCDLARPRPPRPYRKAAALEDGELKAILSLIDHKATNAVSTASRLQAKRDFALLLFFAFTGHRRAEIVGLTWGDLKIGTNGRFIVRFNVKGGDYLSEEVNTAVYAALIDYLQAAGRIESMTAVSPLWIGHNGQETGAAMSSYTFAHNLKNYAQAAGIFGMHIHKLRYTYGRMVADETGDLTAVQTAMGHRNISTTRIYVKSVTTKKDKHSGAIRGRLGL